ncbi:hypothetical protein [Pontibaca methylaminivorans]|uniref:MxaK protein n=1 Tax=Pontibaca methylaminivorans TaxID=515897 RepID=A0A1R3WHU6_9RHOB|nr:hypothetical protein [Pontibaca methylaminivorans]SIT77422.1 mxaK protein [Pontibaca methylaminivorans]
MRRLALILMLLILLASGAGIAWFAHGAWGDWRDNSDIRAMAAGRQAVPRENADARAIQGRVLYLAHRDLLTEALEVLPLLSDAPPALLAEARYAIGNSRLRGAFVTLETGIIDDATPEVNLAKSAYRAALRARPGDWNAKLNLELAMRLVRDLPRPEAEGESDPDTRPRRLWTDVPGMPRGGP